MFRLKHLLIEYVKNTENAETNLQLALEYFRVGHYAAALSFFLRAAERTTNVETQYFALLKVAKCLEIAGNRLHTVRTTYQHCIDILPSRPEAYYFLSKVYEWQQDWTSCYTTVTQGLRYGIAQNKMRFQELIEYPGSYALLFQKALAAWWWGKNNESRDILEDLSTNYKNKLDQSYKSVIQYNMAKLASPSIGALPNKKYTKASFEKLKFKFPGAENIQENYAQIYQDLFVLVALNGKTNGTFLEIGSGDPVIANNTYLLETQFDWTGYAVEINKSFAEAYVAKRKTLVFDTDARDIDYENVVNRITHLGVVDYLQLDCEPAKITYETLLKIPFDKCRFRVITYEHDYYADIDKIYREKSRLLLASNGYILVVNDLCSDYNKRYSFEDWWIHKDLVDKETIAKLLNCNLEIFTDPDQYFGFR